MINEINWADNFIFVYGTHFDKFDELTCEVSLNYLVR